MKKGKIIFGIIGGVLAVFALVLLLNFHTTKIVYENLLAHKIDMDESAEWSGGTSYENIQYSNVSETDYLHLYVPKSDKPLPLYIMVHGGGFFYNNLESRQAQLFYRTVRNHGYAVATINYRLGSEAKYPAAIEDVKAAVRFLRANADSYGIDSDHFAIAGESAGGYLACMAAVTNDEEFMGVPFLGEEEHEEPVSAKVQAVVDFYGCVQFFIFEEEFKELKIPKIVRTVGNSWMNKITKGTGNSSVEELWLGKKISEMSEDELERISVSYYAKENLHSNSDLRVLILHGNADITVPYLQSSNFKELLTPILGEDQVTYRLFPQYGHATDGFYSDETLTWMINEIGW